MTKRTTITLNDEAARFLEQKAGDNRSAYINQLILNAAYQDLQNSIIKANEEEAREYDEELKIWETTLNDGLEP